MLTIVRRLTAVCVSLLALVPAVAQPRFAPAKASVGVGDIMFQSPHKVTFEFTNTGNRPLTIAAVHPSCGCVSVDYPKRKVAAGASGTITAIYDAAMLGVFVKELEVVTNASNEPVYLTFHGKVTTKPSVPISGYPIDLDNVRLNTNVMEFDDVNKGDKPVAELLIHNPYRQAYQPQLMHLPPYLTATYLPEKVPGGGTGRILVTLDSDKLPAMGLNQTSIYLARFSGDKIGAENEISVSAVLLPDFTGIEGASLAFAPQMMLTDDVVRLGPWGKKTKLKGEINILNDGRTPLEISRLQVFNKAVGVSLSTSKIAPKSMAKLRVTVEKKYLGKDKNRLRILLITNDPKCPKKIVTVEVRE